MSRAKRKPLEFFKFFWRDFNRDTAHLTRAQRDGYLQIMCAYYDNHGPLHENAIMKASGATSDEWDTERNILALFFTVGADGLWRHKRIEAELKDIREVSKKRANAGSLGGKRKAIAKQTQSKSLATKDVSNEQAAPAVPIAKQRLSNAEKQLMEARERVWALEAESKKAQNELDAMNGTGDFS